MPLAFDKTPRPSRRVSRSPQIESLEGRQLLSAAVPARNPSAVPSGRASSDVVASPRRVIGYLPEYRYSSLSHIDFSALTHVNYFSISATDTGALSSTKIDLSHLAQARNVAHAAGVTMSITVGPQSFGSIAGSSTALNTFVTNMVQFVQSNDLDGIDIDWEPAGTAPTDKQSYGAMIDALYAKTHPLGLFLSAAVNPVTLEIPVAQANKLDWVNIMAYDFAPAKHSSFGDSTTSLARWNNYGVTASKLVLGVPFYGRAGTAWANSVTETYSDIIGDYHTATGAYPAPTTDVINGQNFNGPATIAAKSQFVIDNAYGGVMIWELGQDHFSAQGAYDQYSLLPAIKSVIHPTQDRTAPTVTTKAFDFETGPSVRFQFSESVAGTIAASDLTIRRIDNGATLTPLTFVYDDATHTATANLPPQTPDGDYRATFAAGSVADAVGNSLATASTLDFFVLAGDVTRDGTVDFADLVVLAQNYGLSGRTFSQGNIDYSADGVVGFDDLTLLAQHYGAGAPPVASITLASDSISRPAKRRVSAAI